MPEFLHLLHDYARRLHADLDANTSERQRLRDGLHRLEQEHHVLMNVQITLNSGASVTPVLLTPHQRGGRRRGERPLIDIVGTLLREHGEPCSVAQICRAVIQTRPTTEQTVRNTLDRLVATGKAERIRRGRSVFYSGACAARDQLGEAWPRSEVALSQGEKPS